MKCPRPSTLVLAVILVASAAPSEAAPTLEELYALVQAQQAEINELKARLATNEASHAVTEERLTATADYLETRLASAPPTERRSHIGGYGELHYNNLDADDSGGDVTEADFHRFVLYFGHDFSERLRFVSEIELEHSIVGEDNDGEVELEQAYIEMDLDDSHYLKTGLFLVPVGLLNETHEPPTFYGVERNDVESVVIPSTWWEAGVGVGGHYSSGVSWDLAAHTGLETPITGSSAYRIRSGRQKVSNAAADNLAYSLRVSYTGVPGLELAGTLHYQTDMTQVDDDGMDEGLLTSIHGVWNLGNFTFKALWAKWDIDGSGIEAADVDQQDGWFVEPSYRFGFGDGALGLYFRYQDVDAARTVDRFDQWEVGFNYWPIDNVVFKFDYRDRQHDLTSEQGRDFQGIDLGVGYQF